MTAVYVLNNQYECVSTTSPRRAFALVASKKAMVVKESAIRYGTAGGAILVVPMMIRLFYYVKAFGRAMAYNRSIVFDRDENTCQYCGHKFSPAFLTEDHVTPKCQGGKRTYENIVCACKICNNLKADRTPEQAGMRLLRKPFKPAMTRSLAAIHAEAKRIMEEEFKIRL